MISWSSVFEPISLDVLIVPLAMLFGVVVVMYTKKIVLGILTSLVVSLSIDLSLGYFYYGRAEISFLDTLTFASITASFTWILSWALFKERKVQA